MIKAPSIDYPIKKRKEYKANVKLAKSLDMFDHVINKIANTPDNIYNYYDDELAIDKNSADFDQDINRSYIKTLDSNLPFEDITCVPSLGIISFPVLKNLRSLTIFACINLKELPIIPTLEILCIKYNTTLNKIPNFPNLRILNLENTFITSIPKLKKLSTFDSKKNNIYCLPCLPNLTFLSCDNLHVLPPELPKIITIICDSYYLKRLPNTYVSLEVLHITNTKIIYIPEELINLKFVNCAVDKEILINLNYLKNICITNAYKKRKNFKTFSKMQRKYKLKIAKSKMRLLYNPLYIGGYLGKKRLEKVFMS
jgi:hypothetical protein